MASEDVTVQVQQPSPPASPRYAPAGYDDYSQFFQEPVDPASGFPSPSPIAIGSNYSVHPPYSPHSPVLLDYRDPASPSNDSVHSASPVVSSVHSSPYGQDAHEFPPSTSHDNLTDQLSNSLMLFHGSTGYPIEHNDPSLSGPFVGVEGFDENMTLDDTYASVDQKLHINTNVSSPYHHMSAGGSGSHSFSDEYRLPPPDVQQPRPQRHSFSEGSDNQLLSAGPTSRRIGPGSISAPTSPASSVRSYEDDYSETGVSPQDVSPSHALKREPSQASLGSPDIAKPVVTSQAMQSAADRRRKHDAHYRCNLCGNKFTTNFSLKRHLNSHTRENEYRCQRPGCKKVFRNASDCQRHQKKQH